MEANRNIAGLASLMPLLYRIAQGLARSIDIVLACAGLYVTGILTFSHLSGANIYCGASNGCEAVAQDPAAFIGRVPLAAFGLALYVGLIALVLAEDSFYGRTRLLAFNLGYGLTTAGAVASCAVTTYSIVKIHATCAWCLASLGILALLLGHYSVRRARYPAEAFSTDPRRIARITAAALFPVVLAGIAYTAHKAQVMLPPHDAVRVARQSPDSLVGSDSPTMGNPSAPVTLVFFGDFACHACRRTLPALMHGVERKADVRLVYRHFPLPIHPLGYRLAVTAERAYKTTGFWPFAREVLGLQDIGSSSLGRRLLRLNPKDPEWDKERQAVAKDVSLGRSLGFRATPTIVVMKKGEPPAVVSIRTALSIVR